MRFTILSHAGLLVEHSGKRIVCDPWLLGSCYWRSWWNYPEPDPELIENLRADYIYLTHLHWDHFHGPSLRRLFSRKTCVLVPKVPTRRMLNDLRSLGFRNVIEVAHAGSVTLGPDFRLQSYQFGLGVDSAAVISGGGVTLFNCNDAKFFGLPLRQILRDHPTIDFIFRSHSSAGPIPYCVEAYEQMIPDVAAGSDSADQFARCALHVRARYAVPFASNHCFLHRETIGFNATATTPDEVRTHYQQVATRCGSTSECVVMPPGSSWSEERGFAIREFDFSAGASYISTMLARHSARLEASYRREEHTEADFASFATYFSAMLHALPAFVRRLLPPIVFRARAAHSVGNWLVDPQRRSIEQLPAAPPGCAILESHAAVLRDCTERRLFSVWSASKRLRIRIPSRAALTGVQRWLTVLDLYELDTFPLARNFSARALAVRARRWREPAELVRLAARRLVLKKPLSVTSLYPVKAV